MNRLNLTVSNIVKKVGQIIDHNNKLDAENQVLKQEIADLKENITEYNEIIQKLNDQISLMRLSTNNEQNIAQNKEMNERITQYIKDIDKCLKLLQ
ncbi:MAG: hypothetical protein R2798_10845 [Chitinophagales bacterium]|nr:hypothetical protein [Bacteroidota bacterium]MCB9043342.1 hypothetical protein [Chitinophagales bacterium]